MKGDDGRGCLGIVVLIAFAIGLVYTGIDNWIHSDEIDAEKAKKRNEFVNYWRQSNIDFFKGFNCSKFSYHETKQIKTESFYAFYSWRQSECSIKDFRKMPTKYLGKKSSEYYVDDIKDANVLIWIKQIKGEREGGYSDGSRAIRLNTEINFIDLRSNTIFRKLVVAGTGEPPEQISKKGYTSPSIDVYFGGFDFNKISTAIEENL